MRIYLIMSFIFFLMVSLTWAMIVIATPRVNLEVRVVDERREAVENAQVIVSYPGRISGQEELFRKLSDEEGRASFSGSSFLKLRVKVEKEGYYNSHQEVTTFKRVDRKNVYSDQAVTLVLREVRNPTAMYACREAKADVPELNKPIGYDLVKGDWVVPYGEGKVTDLLFNITGKWISFDNHDSYLHVTFPNPGDGISSFVADSQSVFKSPYEAPVDGYTPTKSLRKARTSVPVEGFQNKFKTTIIDETSYTANYIVRLRTVLDENGKVKEALYGKIYGDFKFDGATLDTRYRSIIFSYYLNPTPNDQNLEYDPKQNLMKGIKFWNQPEDP